MSMVIDQDLKRIVFIGEISVLEAQEITSYLKENLELLRSWKKIRIDLQEAESLDSAILQILVSLYRTFPDKTVFSVIPDALKNFFQLHKLKFSSKN